MEVFIILGLILLNGVFSMSEIALVSAKKIKLETAAKKGSQNAKAALKIARAPNRFFSTVQIGITLIGILTGLFSGEKITNDLESWISGVGLLSDYAHSLAVILVVVIITFFTLVLGELVPKRIGLAAPEKIAKLIARPMNIISLATAPFVWLLTTTSDIILRTLNIRSSEDSFVTEEEIRAIIRESSRGGDIQPIEQDIVEHAFNLGDRKVSSLMTHRNDVVFLDAQSSNEKIIHTISEYTFSSYPVMEDGEEKIIGVVRLKDIFRFTHQPGFTLIDHVKTPKFIVETASVYQALEQLQKSEVHFGIVLDEFGHMQGIITVNDILRVLVSGTKTYRPDDYTIREHGENEWLVDGLYPFPDLLHYFHLNHLAQEYDAINTVSGLILNHFQNIPREGDSFRWLDYQIEVIDMDRVKIDKVRIKKIAE